MSECKCTGQFLGLPVTSVSCPVHGAVRASPPEADDAPRVVYKVWVEIERSIYDPATGDEGQWEDVGLDLLEGAHVAEFMAVDSSPEAEHLAQLHAQAFGTVLSRLARETAHMGEANYRAVTGALLPSQPPVANVVDVERKEPDHA